MYLTAKRWLLVAAVFVAGAMIALIASCTPVNNDLSISALTAQPVAAKTLRIGISEDPDVLDPVLGRTFVGRIVFASLCDKLFDLAPNLNIIPQLATENTLSEDGKTLILKLRQGVVFHDGEPFNAAAVKYNLERSLKLPGSNRKGEIKAINSIEVVDEYTIKLILSTPSSPLLAQLTDRAGMMISPKAGEALGEKFGQKPVCSGPFKFTERVSQDRIVVERFDRYWNKDAIAIDKIIFLPIPDDSVRLSNLRSGDLDLIERVNPNDRQIASKDAQLELTEAVSLGYQGISINLANPKPLETPLAKDPRVRRAFELSLDRNIINKVVYDGEFVPGNQPVPPDNRFYIKEFPMPKRDLPQAKALLKEAGYDTVKFTLMVPNSPESLLLGQVIQVLAKEAGFDIALNAVEFATTLDLAEAGKFEAYQSAWSGRIDPDGNIYSFNTCEGPRNDGHYCDKEVDNLLNLARTTNDFQQRYKYYQQATERYLKSAPIIYLYHAKLLWAYTKKLTGFKPYPDGIIRPQGLAIN